MFLSSVFPIASLWLGISAFVLSISFLVHGREERKPQRKESEEIPKRYDAEGINTQ